MKSTRLICATAAAMLCTLSAIPLCAQDGSSSRTKHHHYQLIDIGTFGGPSSYFNALYVGPFFSSAHLMNRQGNLAGWADSSAPDPFPSLCFDFTLGDCFAAQAFLYEGGFTTDLGVLAEGWSSAALSINDANDIAGISQNGVIDPLTGVPEQRAVVWRHGQIMDLGTLGGNLSAAFSINNRGQVAGLALNTVADPFSIYDLLNFNSPGGTQTRAVLWDENGNARDLGTLGGADAYAAFVNDRGQVTGWSYTNSIVNPVTTLPTFHPFLWDEEHGMQDLGTLGGTQAQAVNGINNHGEVVGATTLAGDQTHHPFLWDGKRLIDLGTFGGDNGEAAWVNDAEEVVGLAQPTTCPPGSLLGGGHAFLWHHGTLKDLGTTAGLDNSEADYINSRAQVVGYSFSCDGSNASAFLWEKGSIVDLNSLIPSDSGFYLWTAQFVSDEGEIAALGLLPGGQHVVILIPCDENHPAVEGCDYSMVEASADVPGENTHGVAPSGRAVNNLPFGLQSQVGLLTAHRFPRLEPSKTVTSSSPIVALSPTNLMFSTQAIGTTSAPKNVTLKNTGTASLSIRSIAITGTNFSDFAQTHTCGTSLAAGASCTISVTFKPKASGTRTGALRVSDNAAGSPQKVSLSGIGTTAKLSPTSLNFGSIFIGNTSVAQAVTLTNVGATTLTIVSISITGINTGDFAESNNCSSLLAANASCSVDVKFKPTATGTRTAALRIADSAAGSPQAVSLTGKGVTGKCTPLGAQCPPIFPPCCPGLVCVPASTRAFCEPATSQKIGPQALYEQDDKTADHTPILKDTLPDTSW